jgi:YD repeat-containing protein
MNQSPLISSTRIFFENLIKKHHISYLLMLMLFYFSSSVFAQAPGTDANALTNIQVRTPEVSNFMKYGGLSSSSYTGALKIELPIANIPIKDNGSFNVSLEYTGSGFKPAMRDGIVGQGWSLNVGGAISRQVNGIPDTEQGREQNNYIDGFIIGAQNNLNNQDNPSNVFNFNPNTTYISGGNPLLIANNNSNTTDPNNYEADPDIFFFNFNGISGKFFMGNGGDIKVATNSPVKLNIDITNIGTQGNHSPSIPCIPSNSEIVISDDRGNKYFFGGATKNLDYSLVTENVSGHDVDHHHHFNPVIDTWYMSHIEYYNGYTVDLNYKDDSGLNDIYNGHFADLFKIAREGDPYPEYLGTNDNIRDFILIHEFYSENTLLQNGQGSLPNTPNSAGFPSHAFSLKLQKRAVLESVSSSDFKISFYYSRQNFDFNRRTDNYPQNIENENFFFEGFHDIKLDRITVSSQLNNANSDSFDKAFSLKHENLGGEFSRLYLTSLKESGKPEYQFKYYSTEEDNLDENDLPVPITRGVDHWGYWNGKDADDNLLMPTAIYSPNNSPTAGDYYFNSDARDPVFVNALAGQLHRISYPTGGYSIFDYEPHTYTKRLQAVSSNAFIPDLIDMDEEEVAGGLRISAIEDFSENNSPLGKKEYLYEDGVLMKWPRYALYFGYYDQWYGYIRSNPIGRNLEESLHMTYSQVTEKNIGNGKTVTKFRDFISNGDDHGYNWRNFESGTPNFQPVNGGDNLAKGYFAYLLNDRSIERGKPEWVKVYDNVNNNDPIEETIFTYNDDPNRFNQFSAKLHTTGPFIQSNKLYYYSDFLTKKEHKNYLNGNTLITVTDYDYYDYLKKLKSTTITNSDNSIVKVENFYYEVNNLNLVLKDETRNYKDGETTSVQYVEYGNHLTSSTGNKYYPIEMGNYKFIPGQTEVQMKANAKKVFVNKYDTKGNPLEVTVSNGNVISYIWGYGETLLLAKIEGVNYDQIPISTINDIKALSNIDTDSYPNVDAEIDLKQALNELRDLPVLSNAMITTYTHNPLTGVTSVTDTRGNSQQYEYDSNERLLIIKDKYGNRLSKNEYNYKP